MLTFQRNVLTFRRNVLSPYSGSKHSKIWTVVCLNLCEKIPTVDVKNIDTRRKEYRRCALQERISERNVFVLKKE